MRDTFIKRLRDDVGLNASAVATKAGLTRGQISQLENGKHGLTEATATKLGAALGVDPMLLMVGQGFDALHAKAQVGEISPREVAVKGAQLLQLAHETPGLLSESEFNRFVNLGQGIHQLAEKVATKARRTATKDTMSLLGRDGVGRSARKAVGGANPLGSYRTGDVPVSTPQNRAATNPSAEALVDAVQTLEDDIENGTVEGADNVLSRVANIINEFAKIGGLSGDPDAQAAYAKLKRIASNAASGIGSTTTKSAGDRWPGAHRGAGGIATKKRYGA